MVSCSTLFEKLQIEKLHNFNAMSILPPGMIIIMMAAEKCLVVLHHLCYVDVYCVFLFFIFFILFFFIFAICYISL